QLELAGAEVRERARIVRGELRNFPERLRRILPTASVEVEAPELAVAAEVGGLEGDRPLVGLLGANGVVGRVVRAGETEHGVEVVGLSGERAAEGRHGIRSPSRAEIQGAQPRADLGRIRVDV